MTAREMASERKEPAPQINGHSYVHGLTCRKPLSAAAATWRGFSRYLPVDPGRVVLLFVPSVDVPGVLPTPCWLLTLPPTLVPVVPCIPVVDEPEPVPVAPPDTPAEPEPPADPPAEPPPDPPPPPPPPWANAREELSARTTANVIVASFIHCPFKVRAESTTAFVARS